MFYGLFNLPWWGYILVTLVFTHITIVGITVFLHRHQAHRALDMHPALSHFFRLWLWVTTGMVTKAWAAIHRKHHAKCETEDDPHSPQIFGLPKVLLQGAELYRREALNQETLERYGQGTPNDKLEDFYLRYTKQSIYVMLVINLILFGVPGLAIWAIQMAWTPFFAAGVINGVGHFFGYRNYECPDQARNISPWGLLIGGEELHNNHHTYPTSAKFSVKWWEFDLGWLYIRLFETLGLVKVKRTQPKPILETNKTQIDMQTVKAIIINRFQIMARYTKEVMLPLFHQEKAQTKEAGNRNIQRLLVRESSLLDSSSHQTLKQWLANNASMQRIYHFKESLQSLWAQTSLKEMELLEALQKWCHEAEVSGINSLKQFAAYLKTLTIHESK